MPGFEFGFTFDDGVEAGKSVVDVASRCSADPTRFPGACDRSELEDVFRFVEKHGNGRRVPLIEGFLSQVVRGRTNTDSLIELWGVSDFIENQSNYAPICNLPDEFQLIQFGSWCGERSDGDGWCIDFADELIRCIPVACDDDHGVDYLKRCSYGCFPTLKPLGSYLLSVAETRDYCRNRMAKNSG